LLTITEGGQALGRGSHLPVSDPLPTRSAMVGCSVIEPATMPNEYGFTRCRAKVFDMCIFSTSLGDGQKDGIIRMPKARNGGNHLDLNAVS